MMLRDLNITPKDRMYVVAEVGSNWHTLEDCIKSIEYAAATGADAVKFQYYTHHELYGYHGSIPGELPREWIPALWQRCHGIEFMCTAFSPDGIDAVDPYVKMHKIASSEITHRRMLECVREKRKPVVLSCGGANERTIGNALEILGDTEVVLMYCVAAYPAVAPDFRVMDLLRERFGRMVGYSDHTTSVTTVPLAAKAMGARVLEKHFMIEDTATPDSGHSLNYKQFHEMQEHLNSMVPPRIGPSPEESDMTGKWQRRLVATQSIKAGVRLSEGVNYGIYRSKLASLSRTFTGFECSMPEGRTLKNDLLMGQAITEDDF